LRQLILCCGGACSWHSGFGSGGSSERKAPLFAHPGDAAGLGASRPYGLCSLAVLVGVLRWKLLRITALRAIKY